ncbi:Hypothetical predicted protein [Scomber scombrus]|uniref:Uncharacterized protein n=1 Tax=Scomber scombrus TaxID=13677 RepID=A0AAV1NAV4_SCOSC
MSFTRTSACIGNFSIDTSKTAILNRRSFIWIVSWLDSEEKLKLRRIRQRQREREREREGDGERERERERGQIYAGHTDWRPWYMLLDIPSHTGAKQGGMLLGIAPAFHWSYTVLKTNRCNRPSHIFPEQTLLGLRDLMAA